MTQKKITKTILIITDGIGCKPDSICNAFKDATKPTYDKLLKDIPKTLISTYGSSVGLPDGQMGNSEVGHMTIGSGRVLYQDLVKISLAIKNNSLATNQALVDTFDKCDTIHLVGLFSDGGVHSHIDHTIALAQIARSAKKRVYLHLITDGRDVSPTSSTKYLQKIEQICDEQVSIATIGGRFYAMDRDTRWDRVQKGYEAIANAIPASTLTPSAYIHNSYNQGITDEFILPIALNGYRGMQAEDGVIITNFRSDRAREITQALGNQEFNYFNREYLPLNIVTMTQYSASFDYPVLFKKEPPVNTLAQTVSRAGLRQLHTAETEKYAHVTFFFNGGIEESLTGEARVLIPSPDVIRYDSRPEMSAPDVGNAVIAGMDDKYEFIVVNFANGDMVGHTGNYDAACLAVNAVDKEIGKIVKKAKELSYDILITSDHGNCEEMKDVDGNVLTNHTAGYVWCFVISDKVEKLVDGGSLSNIAPTLLKLIGLEIPPQMDDPLF